MNSTKKNKESKIELGVSKKHLRQDRDLACLHCGLVFQVKELTIDESGFDACPRCNAAGLGVDIYDASDQIVKSAVEYSRRSKHVTKETA